MIKSLRAVLVAATLSLLGGGAAFAQCSGQFPAGTYCGNNTGSLGLPGPRTLTPGSLQPIAGGTVLGNPTAANAVPTATITPVLGIPGTSQGSLGFAGASGGTATVRAQATAGTPTLLLPTASGTIPSTVSAPLALNATTGGLSITGLAGGVLAGATPAFTTTPVLGASGTLGSLGFGNASSGIITVQPVAGALGTVTVSLPAAAGTIAVSATSPLVLGATSGALTCPTCVTSSGGGAITGTAPITVSAGGVVALTNPLALNFGGTAASLTASNGGLVYSNSTALAILAGTATAGQIPRSGSSAAPSWSTATYPSTAAAGTVLAALTANTVTATSTPVLGIAGTTVGTLGFSNATSGTITLSPVTGALGTQTILLPAASGTVAVSATAPITLSAAGAIGITGAAMTRVDDTNVTLTLGGTPATSLLQATSLTLGWTGQLAMTRGGSGASLTASNGGIVWTDANSMEVLAGTGTAGQMLRSGATATPSWSTNTYPATAVAGTIMAALTANTVTATATPVLGANGVTGGQITLSGSASGTAVIRVAAAAGTGTIFQLPATNGSSGQALTTDGAGILSWTPVGGTGTVTSITQGSLTVLSSNPCTTTCTISSNATITPQGRVTLTTGVPVLTATVTAATTVFYTPYVGNLVPIYDGTNMVATSVAELSIVLGSNWAANSNWDVFIASDAGTIRACTGPAWTSDTGRGTGAGTTEISRTNGLYLNTVTVTCRYNNTTTFSVAASRGTYVGTYRTTAAGQVDYIFGAISATATAGVFNVWNNYNRVRVHTVVGDQTNSWSYAVAAWRQPNANSAMRVSAVRGLNEDGVAAQYNGIVTPGSGANAAVGVGLSSTSAFSGTPSVVQGGGALVPQVAHFSSLMGLGFQFLAALEFNDSATASTWSGDANATFIQAGLTVQLVQ